MVAVATLAQAGSAAASDNGCNTDAVAEICFAVNGGGTYVHGMSTTAMNDSSATINVHLEILGPDNHWNSNEINLNPGYNFYLSECTTGNGCNVAAGIYRAILWQYYSGSYHNVAERDEPIGV
jgi:hypothetical protein